MSNSLFLVKIFEGRHLADVFAVIDGVLFDVSYITLPNSNTVLKILLQADKFKQRAAAELLTGLMRGSKHFPGSTSKQLWDWFTPRLPEIYSKLTLDTLTIWQSFINVSIHCSQHGTAN